MTRRGGARQLDEVLSRMQRCDKHERDTEHRRYRRRETGYAYWRCFECDKDRNKAYRDRIKNGDHEVIPAINLPAEDRPEQCQHTWQRDHESDEDWCHGWRCPLCGVSTVMRPGDHP